MDKLSSCIVREGALDVRDAVGWVVRVATALQSVHAKRQAHSQISAKAVQVARPSCASAGFLIAAEELADQPSHHSPERLAGEGSSPEDDTWALAVLLFECLTGTLPFPGADAKEVKARIRSKPQTLASAGLNEPDLQAVLDETFVLDRSRRLRTVHHVLSRLLEIHPEVSLLPPLMLGKGQPSTPGGEPADADAGTRQPAASDDELPTVQVVLSKEMTAQLAKVAKAATAAKAAKKAAEEKKTAPDADEAARKAAAAAEEAALVRKRAVEAISAPDPDLMPTAPDTRLPADVRPPHATPPSARPAAVPAVVPRAIEPEQDEPPPERKGTGLRDALLVIAFLAIGGLIGFFLLQRLWGAPSDVLQAEGTASPPSSVPVATQSAAAADPGASAGASTAAGTPSASAAATAASTGLASASASAASSSGAQAGGAPRSGDVGTCMQQLFPPDTFSQPPNLDFVCTERDAYKGGVALRVKVIRAGGAVRGVTEGMREWSMLGWYEMAAFAVGRALCCPDAPPLKSLHRIDTCPLAERLTALGAAAAGPDDASVEAALKEYVSVLRCLVAAGTASTFGQPGPPDPGSVTTFRKTLDRVRKAVKR